MLFLSFGATATFLMLATRSLTEEQVRAGMMVSLPSETSKGLSKTEVDEVKLLVHLSKEAGETLSLIHI